MTRWRLAVAVSLLAVAVTATAVSPAKPAEALVARETFDATPRRLGAITVIGDSVLLGSVINSPTIGDQLATNGWGPIRVRGGGSYSTGAFPVTVEARASAWITSWRNTGWDPPTVLVNIGTNDSGFCATSLTCARNAIMHVVDTIGPGHRIWWPQITRESSHQSWADNWNTALAQIAVERTDFFTWDWPAAMVSNGLRASDNIHLSPDGYRTRSRLLAETLTADLARAQRTGGAVAMPVPEAAPTAIIEVAPSRLLDTRGSERLESGGIVTVDVGEDVPPSTSAVAIYLTAPNPNADGYLTVFDCREQPKISSLNYRKSVTRGAFTITEVVDGRFCVASSAPTDLVIDLQAAFVPTSSVEATNGSRLSVVEPAQRLLDTRTTGRARIIEIDVPDGATMVAVSLAAIRATSPGHLVAYPCTDEIPRVATVNYGADEVVAGSAFVPVGPDGTICVFSRSDPDVTVDLTGTFSPQGELAFQPVSPVRTFDVRNGIGGWSPLHGAGQTIDVLVAPERAAAVTGTLTIVRPLRNGHLRTFACGTLPPTASVVADVGQVMTNSITTGLENGRLCLWAFSPTATVFDTTGWWVR